jgi:hypothetical protein
MADHHQLWGSVMLSFTARLEQAKAELAERGDDPLRERVAAAVAGFDALSTVAILTSIGLAPSTGNARRISKTMRALGYIPIKCRRLVPGGWHDTLCRGWARPVRTSPNEGAKVASLHLKTDPTDQQKEACHVL